MGFLYSLWLTCLILAASTILFDDWLNWRYDMAVIPRGEVFDDLSGNNRVNTALLSKAMSMANNSIA